MSSPEKREVAVRKYFIKSPDKPSYATNILLFGFGCFGVILSIVFPVISLLIDSISSSASSDVFGSLFTTLICCSGPFFIGGIILAGKGGCGFLSQKSVYDSAFQRAEPKPSDDQMDAWKYNDLMRIKKNALTKLDLTLDEIRMENPQEPLTVVGPSAGAHIALGKDNIIRFSMHDVVVLYLTDYHLAAYSCTVDMANGLETKESTKEYHYKNVVAVSTASDNNSTFKLVIDGQNRPLANYQKFSLSVASGEKIEVVTAFPQLDGFIKNGHFSATGSENAIKLIRSRLREVAGGALE